MWLAGTLVLDETRNVDSATFAERLGNAHSDLVGSTTLPWLMEVEVLDDPTDPERFLRFGTDTDRMRVPIGPLSTMLDQHPWTQS